MGFGFATSLLLLPSPGGPFFLFFLFFVILQKKLGGLSLGGGGGGLLPLPQTQTHRRHPPVFRLDDVVRDVWDEVDITLNKELLARQCQAGFSASWLVWARTEGQFPDVEVALVVDYNRGTFLARLAGD